MAGLASVQGVGMGLAKGDRGLVGWKLLRVGTGPMAVPVSIAQLIHVCSYGTGLAGVLARPLRTADTLIQSFRLLTH